MKRNKEKKKKKKKKKKMGKNKPKKKSYKSLTASSTSSSSLSSILSSLTEKLNTSTPERGWRPREGEERGVFRDMAISEFTVRALDDMGFVRGTEVSGRCFLFCLLFVLLFIFLLFFFNSPK